MKIKITCIGRGKPTLILKYELTDEGVHELSLLERKLIELGLERSETSYAWGNGDELVYYRDVTGTLGNLLREKMLNDETEIWYKTYDDINKPPHSSNGVNLAMFRVIPSNRSTLKIRLDKFITSKDMREIATVAGKVAETIFSIAVDEEVEIRWLKK